MTSRRFSLVTICFGFCVILLHFILIYTIFNYYWRVKDGVEDEVAIRRSRIKDILESKLRAGTLEASSVASAFDRKNGWTMFNRKKPHIVKIQNFWRTTISPTTTEVPSMTTEKVFRLSQDDSEEKSDFVTSTEISLLNDDDDDMESDEYAEIDDEEQNWMTIELTTPLAIPSSTEKIIDENIFSNSEEISSSTTPSRLSTTTPSRSSTTTPSRPSTTTSSRPSTTSVTTVTRKHYEDDYTKPPVIHITQDLLRRLQPPEVVHKDHKHRWQEHYKSQAPNTTLVTALLDIGRGHWHTYGRPLARYHVYMSEVLKLKVPIIVFVDNHSFEFVTETRKKLGLEKITKIHLITLNDLPLSRHLDVMKAIIHHELHGSGWQRNWDPGMKTHPESKSAAYDLVVNSKPYFVYNASVENPFGTYYFAWIDAGYGQGKPEYFPHDHLWSPHFPPGKISLAKVTPYYDDIRRYSLKDLYRQDRAVISGGFFGGDQGAVENLYHRYNGKVVELLFRYRVVDDDQTTFVLVVNEAPKLFNVLHADWFDAFRLFRK